MSPDPTTRAYQAARSAIMRRFAEWGGEGEAPTLDELERIASANGAYPAAAVAEEVGREALLIYLGVAWGVGPKARWRDRLRVWWAIHRPGAKSQESTS